MLVFVLVHVHVVEHREDKVVLSDEPEVRPNMPDILMRKEVALDRKYKIERFNNIRSDFCNMFLRYHCDKSGLT